MNQKDIKKIDNILTSLVIRNIETGATIEQAKSRSFNTMMRDCPEIFTLYLNCK